MIIRRRKSFTRSFSYLDSKIKFKTIIALQLFEKDPFHDSLRNHVLQWERKWCRSINATGDYRIIFIELSNGNYELVELVDVRTHSQLYK